MFLQVVSSEGFSGQGKSYVTLCCTERILGHILPTGIYKFKEMQFILGQCLVLQRV